LIAVARTLVARDLLLALRRRSDVATALLFFIIVASLFPLGVGAEPNLLRAIAPGVIWVAALLSSMLSLGRLFAGDYADGTLEQLVLGAAPLGVVVAAKALAHWLVAGLPLVLIAPLIALQYDIAPGLYGVLALSLLLGTPVLSIIGAIGAALTLGLRGGGVLLSLLVLPLYVPVLILGALPPGSLRRDSSCCSAPC
jgi:heme exporter protein B